MSDTIIKQPLLEDSDASDAENEYLDNSYRDKPGTSRDAIRADNEAELDHYAQNVPDDKLKFTYIVFYLLGITTVLPWNFFLMAEEYWMYKFRNVTDNSTTILTPIQASIISDLTVAGSVPGTVFLILNALVSHLISLRVRMIGSMIVVFLFFIVTTAFVEVDTDNWQNKFFVLTLFIVIFINAASAVLTGSVMGLAGLFPSIYVTAIVSGQALSGIFSAFSDIMSLTLGAPPKTTAFVYFCIGNVTVVIALLCYITTSQTAFFKFHMNQVNKRIGSSSSLDAQRPDLEPRYVDVIRKIYVHAFTIWFVFVVTLCVYPAVTVLIQSEHHGNGKPWNDIYFMPVVNYLLFNSGDYLGRVLAGFIELPKSNPHTVLLMASVRTAFIPMLMMGNSSLHNFLPVVIQSDAAFIIIMACFAISNGYITNITLIMAPKAVMPHEKEMASSMMAAALGLGLAFGSIGSMAFIHFF